jgi:hypothetical protein
MVLSWSIHELEECGLFNVRFEMRGVITASVSTVKEQLISHIKPLTHHKAANEPNESAIVDKYIQDNSEGRELDCDAKQELRDRYQTLTDDETAVYLTWYQQRHRGWERKIRSMI